MDMVLCESGFELRRGTEVLWFILAVQEGGGAHLVRVRVRVSVRVSVSVRAMLGVGFYSG